MFSLESPHRGDSNEYTQYTISQYKKENHINYPKSAAMRFFFQRTQERVRNSPGKRAVSVQATENLLYRGQIWPLVPGILPPPSFLNFTTTLVMFTSPRRRLPSSRQTDGWMTCNFYVLFNSISVISGR